MSGSILAPYVTGYLADTAGSMQVGFYLSCVLLVIGLLAFAFLAKDESKPKLGLIIPSIMTETIKMSKTKSFIS